MKILLPTDGSGYSENAAMVAGQIASKHDSEVIIVHVVEDKGLGRKTWRENGAEHVINSVREELLKRGCNEQNIISEIVDGHAAEMIVKTAKKHNVDRIVIGTRGHTGIKQIMGSVTLKVLQMSPILVLVVPPEFRL
ncbi:MAG: universal stress protein [Methanococcoides sp.]|nr:universal stress protein [Methanococcoides sp.]MCD4821720.1 universal stress protein [Methanococcoides sp.]